MVKLVFQKDHSGKMTMILEASKPTRERYEVEVKGYALKYQQHTWRQKHLVPEILEREN